MNVDNHSMEEAIMRFDDVAEGDSGSDIEMEESKEINLQDYCPNWNEKEETLIYTLLDFSDKQIEDDTKLLRCCSPTGWEEAVQGWGRFSPFSCPQPQKNLKKAKPRDDIKGCVLCSEMPKITEKILPPETKTAPCQVILDSKSCEACMVSVQDNVLLPAEEISAVHSTASSNCSQLDVSKTDTSSDKWCAPLKYQGQLQQINELSSWYQEKTKGPESIMRAFTDFNVNPTMAKGDCNYKESLTLNSFVVLPPVKAAALNDRSFSAGRKSKGASIQPHLRVPSKSFIEDHLYGKAARKMEQKIESGGLEKVPDMAHEQIRICKHARLIGPIIPRGPILQELERLYWQCALIPGKTSATINTIPSKHHAHPSSLELLKAQEAQNKQSMRLDDNRAPLVQHFRNPVEAKRQSRSKAVPTSLRTESIPPSLMITRVEIPISAYRFM